MIDFSNLPVRNKTYAGANGSKISVLYNGELYMLKFPAVPSINKNMSYANGCISESDAMSLKASGFRFKRLCLEPTPETESKKSW